MESDMTNKKGPNSGSDAQAAKNTSAGGHTGGTYSGQKPDAKSSSMREDKGNKSRPNDGKT